MYQPAWLDFYRGKWHLTTSNPVDPIRQWVDKEIALFQLTSEGLKLSGLHPKRPGAKVESRLIFHGYALARCIR
jgi:hypothetical protein